MTEEEYEQCLIDTIYYIVSLNMILSSETSV